MSRSPRAEPVRAPRGWSWLLPAAVIAFVGCQTDRLPSEPEAGPEERLSASAQASGIGADDWIVVFKNGTQDPAGLARSLVQANGGSIRFTYSHAIQGFAGKIPPQAIDAIRQNPNVDFVERDGIVEKTAVGSWGLDRIDQRDLPLNSSYSASHDGTGVDVYIIDTGIDYQTYSGGSQFGSRLDQLRDVDYVDGDDDASDCDGHGTHVSGTVGSTGYGVAPGVTLIGVRVLNCQGSGSYGGVIAGIDYVASIAAGPSVANMSLGGGFSSSLNAAVDGAVAAGVTFAVSSGNSNADACGYSPASAASAITVNASTSSDARSSFSNYGTCTDIFAPGSGITSTIMGGGTQSWSGTSMASPHVAGVAALILESNPGWNAAQVWSAMQDRATRDKISNAGPGSPNLLLFSGTGSGDPCATGGCPDIEVQWISDIAIKTNRGNNGSGTVMVQVIEVDGDPVAGVTVSGAWRVNTTENYMTSSGVTDAEGLVELATGGIRFATDFGFCVSGLSGPFVDRTVYAAGSPCSVYQSKVGGGSGDTGAAAPANLSGTGSQRGKNYRAELAWDGGGATVDVWRGSTILAAGVSNSGSYTDNVGKTPPGSYTYKVCNGGSTTECSGEATVTF